MRSCARMTRGVITALPASSARRKASIVTHFFSAARQFSTTVIGGDAGSPRRRDDEKQSLAIGSDVVMEGEARDRRSDRHLEQPRAVAHAKMWAPASPLSPSRFPLGQCRRVPCRRGASAGSMPPAFEIRIRGR